MAPRFFCRVSLQRHRLGLLSDLAYELQADMSRILLSHLRAFFHQTATCIFWLGFLFVSAMLGGFTADPIFCSIPLRYVVLNNLSCLPSFSLFYFTLLHGHYTHMNHVANDLGYLKVAFGCGS